jgi:hypothetical protein
MKTREKSKRQSAKELRALNSSTWAVVPKRLDANCITGWDAFHDVYAETFGISRILWPQLECMDRLRALCDCKKLNRI